MGVNMDEFFEKIKIERLRQVSLHPKYFVSDEVGMVVLAEEVGEIARAIHDKNEVELESEIIQVATVCLKWIETINNRKEQK